MNRQLKEKFNVEKDLDAVFIDSWAKQNWNLNDNVQQEAFVRETTKLWDSFSSFTPFEFKTIQGNLQKYFINRFFCPSIPVYVRTYAASFDKNLAFGRPRPKVKLG